MPQQLKINLPHVIYCAPDPQVANDFDATRVRWTGPEFLISKTANWTAPQQDASYSGWQLTVKPDELGWWSLQIGKGDLSTATNLAYQERFECVSATDREIALGVQNSYQGGLVESYPTNRAGTTYVTHEVANGVSACFISQRNQLAPMDGYIYGLKVYSKSDLSTATLTSMKFITVGADPYMARGISNDIKGTTWASNDWTTVTFTKPVPVRAGDGYGFELVNGSGGALKCLPLVDIDDTGSQLIRSVATVLNMAAGNSFAAYGAGDGLMPAVKLLMHPPSIAIAGNSIWAGHPASYTMYEDTDKAAANTYVRASDPAAILQNMLGVTCVSCGDGGTTTAQWCGATGYWAKVITPLHPACVIFDCTYNDTANTNEEHMKLLERLVARADQDGIEICFIESPATAGAIVTGASDDIERLNGVTATFCRLHGRRYIPTYYRVGEPTDGVYLSSYRRQQKDISALDADVLDYGESGADPVHLSAYGIKAAMQAVAESFRNRRMVEPRG